MKRFTVSATILICFNLLCANLVALAAGWPWAYLWVTIYGVISCFLIRHLKHAVLLDAATAARERFYVNRTPEAYAAFEAAVNKLP